LPKGVDVRDSGSGHATTTNTIRQAGFGPGAVVFTLDLAKGLVSLSAFRNLAGKLPAWLEIGEPVK
jgi:glycerol-3-phosphate acyltransferase PlsY